MNRMLKALLGFAVLATTCSTTVWSQSTTLAEATPGKGAPELSAKATNGASALALPDAPMVAGNYVFSTTTTGSLTDMSAGTTQLVAPSQDDTASAVTAIGFEFIYQGVRYTQFSANSNGVIRLGATAVQGSTPYKPLAQANVPLISAYGADQRTHTTGRVHFRLLGTAPSRQLVIEFLNMQSDFNAGGTVDLNYQVRLNETTGIIEFVYGGMTMSAAGAADANSRDPHIGFSTSNTVGNVGTVTAPQSGTPAPTFNGATASAVANLYTAGAIPVLSSAADGVRRTFQFAPATATAPTALTFTAVTALGMTLNWVDSPNELNYEVYLSTDGVTYALAGTALQNATTFAATGLTPSTNYFWRVVAVAEGSLSTPLAGSQPTGAPGNVASTGAGGNWSDPATWVDGNLPLATDNVTIANGATVTIDTAAVALSVTIGTGGTPAILQWDSAAARTLVVGGAVTIATNGRFSTQEAGTITAHNVSVAANLVNDGVLDFSTNSDTAGAGITFTGASSNNFGGIGATTDVRAISMNKGAIANVLILNPTNFTVRGLSTDSAGFLTLTSGTLRIGGTFAVTNRVFATAAYTIPATGGIWLDNPNFVVAGTASGTTTLNNGLLRVSQGLYNIGLGAGDGMRGNTGSFVIEGGTVSSAGRIDPQGAVSYTQSGGTVNVGVVGNSASNFGTFEIYNNTTSSFTMSGGTINLINRSTGATQVDFQIRTLLANINISGGQVVFGATGAPPTATFRTVGGMLPNFTINAGMTLDLNNVALFMRGTTAVNNGAITFTGASARFDFGSQVGAMSYSGTGVFGTALVPLGGVGVSANSPFLTTLSAPIVANRINLFQGGFVNSNQITLGNGGASTTVVQIGSTGLTTAGGSFDVSPVHNQGTGGQIVLYAFETAARSTGVEINPTRILTSINGVDNPIGVTITGGDLSLSSAAVALTLNNGSRLITGANTLTLTSPTATVTRTPSGHVDGNFRKTYAAAASKTFEVGTANGYSPVLANATAGTFPTTVTVRAIQAVAPTIFPPADAITRHWVITAPDVSTANLTFTYLDPADLSTVTEADLLVYRRDGATFTNLAGTVNTTANTGAVTGVTTFGVFTLAEPGVTSVDQADLQITKTDGVTTVTAGGSTTYTITASNPSGPQGMIGATIADAFPASLTCTWTCAGSGGGACTAAGSGDINDTVDLPVGGAVTYTASCTIDLLASGSLVNTATVTVPDGTFDTDVVNNTATDTDTIVAPQADLSITKTDGVTSVAPGQSTIYTIVASNAGPTGATGATVADTFPAALTGCTWTCSGSGGGTCAAPSGSGNISELVNLPSGGSATFLASCTVSPSASGSLANTATIATPAGFTDPTTDNNSATDTDTVQQTADVQLLILNDFDYVTIGDNVTLTVVVQNAGLSPAPSVAIAGLVPPELGFFSWSCVGLSGGTCGAPAGIGSFTTTANLPTGGTVLYTVQAKVLSEDANGSVSFSATATVGGSVVDPNTSNNTDTWDADVVLFRNGFDCTVGRGDCAGEPESPPDYATGFEAPDFTVGDVTEQQGWFAQFSNWLVSTANPPEGAQAVQGLSDGLGASFSLSPTLPAGAETHSYASARMEINNTGTGATWQFAPQDTGAALVITRLQFVPGTNAIQVLQGDPAVYVTIPSVTWPSATPFDIKVITRRADGEMQVCLNGTSIFTGTAISTTANARDTRNVAIISLMEAGSIGSTIDYDSVEIDNTDSGGCAGPAAPRYVLIGEAPGSAQAHTATASSTRQ